MPIYDYDCSSCRHRVEVIHRIHDAGPRFCPSCGAEGTMRKALVSPAIHFKGSGWAKKDRSSASSKSKVATPSSAGDSDSADAKGTRSATSESGGSAGPSGDAKGSTSTASSEG